MNVQSIQPTPNPNAFKFVVDRKLTAGTKHYQKVDDAAGHALAESLFGIAGVATLFFCDNFVTISMTPEADWRAVHEQATRLLEASEEGFAPPPTGDAGDGESTGAPAYDPSQLGEADRLLLEQINDVLDDRVRPALAGDGGGLEVLGLDGKTLQIRYQGACGTCPSSVAGTLTAIQNLLQSEIDEELTVVPA